MSPCIKETVRNPAAARVRNERNAAHSGSSRVSETAEMLQKQFCPEIVLLLFGVQNDGIP